VRQAVAEIKKVAKKDAALDAEGALTLLERMSPAFEQVDSSSGSIGTAVNNAIAELVPIIAGAPADVKTRAAWLERLFEAHQADGIARKYPHKAAGEILADLVKVTPGDEGKWFAAAKDAGLYTAGCASRTCFRSRRRATRIAVPASASCRD